MAKKSSAPLPEAPIPVLSNNLIRRCLDAGWIAIQPFDEKYLAPSAYRLRSYKVRYHRRDEDSLLDSGSILLSARAYALQPKENVVVSIEEQITLREGLVADFYAASGCIEQGLVLTAGRLEPHYEHAIVLGLFNASDEEIILSPDLQIARVTFGWLGAQNLPSYQGGGPGDYIKGVGKLRDPKK